MVGCAPSRQTVFGYSDARDTMLSLMLRHGHLRQEPSPLPIGMGEGMFTHLYQKSRDGVISSVFLTACNPSLPDPLVFSDYLRFQLGEMIGHRLLVDPPCDFFVSGLFDH